MRLKARNEALEPEVAENAAGPYERRTVEVRVLNASVRQARRVVVRCVETADKTPERYRKTAGEADQWVSIPPILLPPVT